MCVIIALKINSNNDFFFPEKGKWSSILWVWWLGNQNGERAIKDMGTLKNGKITSVNKRKSYINGCP